MLSTAGQSSSQVSQLLWGKLPGDWPKFLGYAFAFVLMWTNMVVLIEIAVMPFVLQVYTTYSGTRTAVVLFAFMQTVTGLTLNILWRYAATGHRLVDPKLTGTEIRYSANRGLLAPVAVVVSIGTSFLSVPAAQYFWVVPLVMGRFAHRYGVE